MNVDPALVYRGLDVWTGKPTLEQRARVEHELVDLVEPERPFSVKEFQRLAAEVLAELAASGTPALLVGASGLYFRAAVDRLRFPTTDPAVRDRLEREAASLGAQSMHRRLAEADPIAASRIEPGNVRRTVRALEVIEVTGRAFSSFRDEWDRFPPGNVRVAGVWLERDALRTRIERRVEDRFDALLEEVRGLLAAGHGPFLESGHLIGYAEAVRVLRGEWSAEEAKRFIVRRDRGLARRQLAWFRRDPRVRWFQAGPEGALGLVEPILRYLRQDPPSRAARARTEEVVP